MAQILKDFKTNLIQFFDSLIEQFPEEGNFVLFRILVKDQIPSETIITYFINSVLPYKSVIKSRDEKFFTEMDALYFGLDSNQTGDIKRLWKEGRFDSEDKQIMWQWIDTFVSLSEKYQKSMSQ